MAMDDGISGFWFYDNLAPNWLAVGNRYSVGTIKSDLGSSWSVLTKKLTKLVQPFIFSNIQTYRADGEYKTKES